MSEASADSGQGVQAIVAAHGDLAAGLVDAVRCIIGRSDVFVALTNRDLTREALEAAIRHVIDETGARVVFTDLPAGSWTMAARRVQREIPDLVVVTGASLPVLLDFACSGAGTPDAARHAAERGRQALLICEPPAREQGPA